MDFRAMGKGGEANSSGLVRQSSVYGLTFEEFQNSLGPSKDFGSMNMDELLKSIWTAEEAQTMAALSGATGLQRQPSLTLPQTLSQKTVDEVWKDMFKEGGVFMQPQQAIQKQPTLGEITLEEFLVRAGLVRDDTQRVVSNGGSLVFGEASGGVERVTVAALGSGYGGGEEGGMRGNEDSSPMSGGGGVGREREGGGRGRRHGGVGLERVVERRQRRMIKNRESAARSRARKQAYTMELEAEIAKLKEQNAQLQRKQEEYLMMQKNQAMEKMNQPRGPKKHCLRRTLTGPW
ncbi:bZIP transcription factor TRAB1-like [Wolffia australiana]